MYKKLCLSTCFAIIVGIANIAAALDQPVAYYPMDEGSGTSVADASGNGHDGTIVGSVPWVEGAPNYGMGLDFPATAGNYVNCGTFNPSGSDEIMTVSAWFKVETLGGYQCIVGKAVETSAGTVHWQLTVNATGQVGWKLSGTAAYAAISTPITAGEWYHVAMVKNGTDGELFINGASVGTQTGLAAFPATGVEYPVMIGVVRNFLFNGIIDEVALFHAALSQADIQDVMNGALTVKGPATGPKPGSGDNEISISNTTVSWKPGPFAYTHNVFFGTDFNDVNDSTVAVPLGSTVVSAGQAVDANTFAPGKLQFGTTYYWRVDEANQPPDKTVYKGKIWSFTTELEGYELAAENVVGVEFYSTTDVYDNQDPNTTYNGVGLDDVNGTHSNDGLTMWVGASDVPGEVWLQYELDQVYKLYQLKIWNYNDITYKDFGAKDVNVLYSIDNVTWKALDEIQVFPMATGESTYKADIFVDMNGALAKYVKLSFLSSYFDGLYTGGISEIKFLVIPTRASSPSPANNATNVNVDSILSWKAGRGAAVHKIYVSSDEDSVIDRNSNILSETTDPNYSIALDLGRTYYWRVDEVNEAEEYTIWDGPVWKFSTPQYILIDGFETGYGNNVSTNAVFLTWKDGAELGDPSNGSYMGRASEPYLQTINHSGGHSAPMKYDNTSLSYSEVKAETSKLLNGPDWSKGNPGALVIWFMSDANDINEPALDRLYVEIGSTKKVYNGSASDIRRTAWTKWEIPLAGVSLGNVTSITIGVERIGSAGGMGILYFDDIMLTQASPLQPAPVNPGTDGLLARYSMENNVQDSSGNGLNGTLTGTANGGLTYADGLAGFGKALVFDGNDDCVDLGQLEAFNFEGSFSISLWAKMDAWSTSWGNVMISNRGETTGGGWQIRRYTNNTVCFTTRGVGTSQDDTNTNFNVAIREWNNITCVYDSEAHTKSIYINGVLDRTVNLDGTVTKVTATTTKTYIGARSNSGNTGLDAGNFFKGAIDQVLIYNRALSAGEASFLGDPTP